MADSQGVDFLRFARRLGGRFAVTKGGTGRFAFRAIAEKVRFYKTNQAAGIRDSVTR